MTVRIEKEDNVWTIIHSRPEARNAMDPQSADDLTSAFLEFDSTVLCYYYWNKQKFIYPKLI